MPGAAQRLPVARSRSCAATMSTGPQIVAILRRPRCSRCATAAAAPPTLSTSTYGRAAETADLPSDTTGTPSGPARAGSGSAPAPRRASRRPPARRRRICSHAAVRWPAESASMSVTCLPASSSARPADRTTARTAGRHRTPWRRGRDDQRDRVRALGHQAAGGRVGHVAELVDGVHDDGADSALTVLSVDHSGDGRPRHSGPGGDGLQGGPLGAFLRRPFRSITSRYHSALSLGVRRWVSKSTCTMPKRLW